MKRYTILSVRGLCWKLFKRLLKQTMGESGYTVFIRFYWKLLNFFKRLLKKRSHLNKKNRKIRYINNYKYDNNKISFFCTSAKIEEHYRFYINAFKTWKKLGIDITLFGPSDKKFIKLLEEYNIKWYSEQLDSTSRLPTLDKLLETCKTHCTSEYMCYINCDIMVSPEFMNTFNFLYDNFNDFFMVGQRWDWTNSSAIDIEDNFETIMSVENKAIRMHETTGVDYFVFNASYLDGLYIPSFLVPRGRWDHWLTGISKSLSIPLIDTTVTNLVIQPEPNQENRIDNNKEPTCSQVRFNRSLYDQYGGCDVSDADYETYYNKHNHVAVRRKKIAR